ncbi:MAG TPA: pantoate--beta-alanine ligase [Candidatus Acidoferrales bacterium]|nr:pantoate--beta-alanine ligase [Candidatus Acidoferrales bacterium]
MHVVRTPGSTRAIARTLPRPVGFVPTMGALHRGHLSLVERARAENAVVAASIFVNPLQFTPGEDFERYPRGFEQDAQMLEAAGVELLYAPSVERMYPPNFRTSISVRDLGDSFEGAARPGHFLGVATVVAKLLHAVEPTSLYLGQKDVQQTAVLRAMIRDLDMATCVVVCETVRENDGLALSSRNAYLDPAQRRAAPSLYRALSAVRTAIAAGETDTVALRAHGAALIEPPLVLEYLAIVDPQTFAVQASAKPPAVIVGVARAGTTRLLDNLTVPAGDGVDPVLTPLSSPRTNLRS